jgi:hypothetical protein
MIAIFDENVVFLQNQCYDQFFLKNSILCKILAPIFLEENDNIDP